MYGSVFLRNVVVLSIIAARIVRIKIYGIGNRYFLAVVDNNYLISI